MKRNSYLALLQQAEYLWPDFYDWWQSHQGYQTKIPVEKWTVKLKLLAVLDLLFFVIPMPRRIQVVLAVIKLVEWLPKQLIIVRARHKLRRLQQNGLVITAIAGSYAKTSTKNIATHLFEPWLKIAATPKSINTILGIALHILKELDRSTKVYLVEFAEFEQDDIDIITKFVKPNLAIITPIGAQHLQRFGSKEMIAKSIGCLIDFVGEKNTITAIENHDFYPSLVSYGTSESSQFQVTNSNITAAGTVFDLKLPGEKLLEQFTPLLGTHHAYNALPSFWLLQQLQQRSLVTSISNQQLSSYLKNLAYTPRRHQPYYGQNSSLILDNSFNTNPDSIQYSFELLSQIAAKQKCIITMGFSELGYSSAQYHFALGQDLAKQADLVGILQSQQTQSILEGFQAAGGDFTRLVIAPSVGEVLAKIHVKIMPGCTILIEGGYREVVS